MRSHVAALALLAGLPLSAEAQVPAGGEFLVSTYTPYVQFQPAIAGDRDGNFVVVWLADDQDGSRTGVFGQRYDAAGVRLGGEFRVNTYTTGNQGGFGRPGLATHANGDFIVSWPDFILFGPPGQDGSGRGAFARPYLNGAPLGAEFQVNTYTTGDQVPYGVAALDKGRFVISWVDSRDTGPYDVYARRYDAGGASLGAELVVNDETFSQNGLPDVAADRHGGFVVVFAAGPGPGGYDLFARRFDAGGTALGAQFAVNTYTTGDQLFSAVAMGPDGAFVVAWEVPSAADPRIVARRFDANGAPQGGEFRVTAPGRDGFYPDLDIDDVGRFVVTWTEFSSTASGYDVVARRFDASGQPLGPQFRVNTYTTNAQAESVVSVDAAGNFVMAWIRITENGLPGGVFAQRYGGLFPVSMVVDDHAGNGNGNGVLELGENAPPPTLVTTWRNGSGLAQTFQTGAVRQIGPPGVSMVINGSATYQLADGQQAACGPSSGSCMTALVATAQRPPGHLDGTFDETALGSQTQAHRWAVHLGGSFDDVPGSSPFFRFVETLLHNGVTAGCGGSSYCPATATPREQMAVFVLVAKEGPGYPPPACGTPRFADVPASSPFCPYIEELARRGVIGGCGDDNFCPTQVVTREQMSVFLLRTLDPTLDPPACTTPMFSDVPAASIFCRWIEELARRHITSGCGGGRFCPEEPVKREQMAAFLTATFSLTLYAP